MTASPQSLDSRLDEAITRLRAGPGEPLPIEADGEVVAFLVTPEELARLEDERDLALLRAERAASAGQPTASLEEIAARHDVDLRA